MACQGKRSDGKHPLPTDVHLTALKMVGRSGEER